MQSPPVTASPASSAPDPALAATLQRIEARLARIEHTIERLDQQVPAAVAVAVDTADSLVERARASGIDVDERIRAVLQVLERLTAPPTLSAVETLLGKAGALQTVLGSGALEAQSVATVAAAGDALSRAASAPPAPMGPWAAWRATGDPDVQAALGFLVRFAHAFGADLRAQAAVPALPAADSR